MTIFLEFLLFFVCLLILGYFRRISDWFADFLFLYLGGQYKIHSNATKSFDPFAEL